MLPESEIVVHLLKKLLNLTFIPLLVFQYFFTVVLRSLQDLDAGYVDGVLMVDDTAVVSVESESSLKNKPNHSK